MKSLQDQLKQIIKKQRNHTSKSVSPIDFRPEHQHIDIQQNPEILSNYIPNDSPIPSETYQQQIRLLQLELAHYKQELEKRQNQLEKEKKKRKQLRLEVQSLEEQNRIYCDRIMELQRIIQNTDDKNLNVETNEEEEEVNREQECEEEEKEQMLLISRDDILRPEEMHVCNPEIEEFNYHDRKTNLFENKIEKNGEADVYYRSTKYKIKVPLIRLQKQSQPQQATKILLTQASQLSSYKTQQHQQRPYNNNTRRRLCKSKFSLRSFSYYS